MLRCAVLAALGVVLGSGAAGAQQGVAQGGDACNLINSQTAETRDIGGALIYEITGPFLVQCASGSTLQGDHATIQAQTREIEITGNVNYRDATQSLTADRATYTSATGRLYATGNVVFSDNTRGSTLRGPELEYFRPLPGRPEPQTSATGRPHLTLIPSSGENREPLEVDADRISGSGQNQFSSQGRVEIRRSDLLADAARADYTGTPERLQLRGDARITRTVGDTLTLAGDAIDADLAAGVVQQVVSRGNGRIEGKQFTLTGSEVTAAIPGGHVERVNSVGDAELQSERMRVTAPEIRLLFERDSLQQLVARSGAGQPLPLVSAPGFRMRGDSLDARLPGQQLERVIAIGNARGEAYDTLASGEPKAPGLALMADGAGRPATDRDWIVGDTLIGYFAPRPDSVASAASAADSLRPGENVELRRAVASGDARSLYRVREDKQAPLPAAPTFNYLAGREIDLSFLNGELEEAHVSGMRRGLYLQPEPPSAAPPAAERPAVAPGRR